MKKPKYETAKFVKNYVDGRVELELDGYYYREVDLKKLISFLKKAKKYLKVRNDKL